MSASPQWPAEGNALDELIDRIAEQQERRDSRRLWAATMLATDVHVCESILLGRPVLVHQLDPVALRRALRGEPTPDPDSYFRVRLGHLDAIAEGGPFE